MAKNSDDCEFWLPPQFLTDDDEIFTDFKNPKNEYGKQSLRLGRDFQRDFSNGFSGFSPNSDLSSPSTESDEEDYITDLTRKVSHSTLHDSGLVYENKKGWSLSGSPQSTLCSALGGCDCNQGSSRCSTNCPSRVSSPLEMNRNEGAWNLLYAAAGEVARMRLNETGPGFLTKNINDCFLPPRKPSSISVPPRSSSPNLSFHPNQQHHLPYEQQLKAVQFEQLKQQQLMKQQAWGQGKYQMNTNQQMLQSRGRIGKPNLGITTAWPNLEQSQRLQLQPPQQPGAGMRAVFLGNSGSKRDCVGTGVFIPRRFGITPTEPRKKSGCSTVLLPDRVVHALNLNLASVDSQMHNRYNGNFAPDFDVSGGLKHRNGMVAIPQGQQRRSIRPAPVLSPEVRLPQEWTY